MLPVDGMEGTEEKVGVFPKRRMMFVDIIRVLATQSTLSSILG
jgi:hypothetical protein